METNYGGASTAKVVWDVVYTDGGGTALSGGKSVSNNLHRRNTGDGGTVGAAAVGIRGMYKGDSLLGDR